MPVSDLSESAQNHLKAIWGLKEWSDDPVTTTTIAQRTGLKLSTVSGAVSKLADLGLVEHAKYGEISLTARGDEYATAMIRRHRLIEAFLVGVLGYGWDEVHEEAERLEHAVSDQLVDRIDAHLGYPRRDPHGDPIPSASGGAAAVDAMPLSSVDPAGTWLVERISDADPELLRFFATRGLGVGARLRLSPGEPYSDAVLVALDDDAAPIPLGRAAISAVWVSRASGAE